MIGSVVDGKGWSSWTGMTTFRFAGRRTLWVISDGLSVYLSGAECDRALVYHGRGVGRFTVDGGEEWSLVFEPHSSFSVLDLAERRSPKYVGGDSYTEVSPPAPRLSQEVQLALAAANRNALHREQTMLYEFRKALASRN